jgi:hypothetical protein
MANMGKSKLAKPNDKTRTAKAVEADTSAAKPEKKVSQRLIETIERRKKAAGGPGAKNAFGKPPGRRGRRPKAAVEYTPEHQEEETFQAESDYDGIEYDTGIRLNKSREDGSFSLDRFDDYDEELNFDR